MNEHYHSRRGDDPDGDFGVTHESGHVSCNHKWLFCERQRLLAEADRHRKQRNQLRDKVKSAEQEVKLHRESMMRRLPLTCSSSPYTKEEYDKLLDVKRKQIADLKEENQELRHEVADHYTTDASEKQEIKKLKKALRKARAYDPGRIIG